jgi:hypothetical protein
VSSANCCATPRSSDIIPSVMMKGARRRRVTSAPLTTPINMPTAIPPTTASAGDTPPVTIGRPVTGSGTLCGMRTLMLTQTTATAEPTERSIPPAMMISVMPSAAMPTTAVWRRMSSKLSTVKNVR